MSARLPLLWLAIHRRRKLLISLFVAVVVFEALIVVVATSIPPADLLSAKGDPDSLQAFSGSSGDISLASVAGLIGAGLLHPFWIAIQLSAVGSFAASAVASDIEEGTIELIAVRPVSRLRILTERTAALLCSTAALVIGGIAPIVIASFVVDDVDDVSSLAGFVGLALNSFALVLAFAGVGVAATCIARHRSAVLAAVGGSAAVTYAVYFIAQSWNEAAFTRWISPFNYYQPADALVTGQFPWAHVATLIAVFVVTSLFGVQRLLRRDLTR